MTQRSSAGVALLLLAAAQLCGAQSRHHAPALSATAEKNPCFDASDARETRLWQAGAPGALGDDPCRDIPYIQVFGDTRASRAPRPALLIVPGGGYDELTDSKEQAPVAEYFAAQLRVATFVLRYRLVQKDGTYRYPTPMVDGQRAIRFLRAHAHAFGIDPARIAVLGFSAGGHLASTLALHPDDSYGPAASTHDDVDQASAEVNLLGLGYPVISMNPAAVPPSGSYRHLLFGFEGRELKDLQHRLSGEEHVTRALPPVFLFESLDDKRISAQNSVLFAEALQQAQVPAEVHLFPHGEHGSGLSTGVEGEDAWPSMFTAWICSQWPDVHRSRR